MALEVQRGSFSARTSPGTQVIPHTLGVTPKALIFFTPGKNLSASASDHVRMGMGVAALNSAGAWENGGAAYGSRDNQADSDVHLSHSASRSLIVVDTTTAAHRKRAYVASATTTGFTLEYSTADSNGAVVYFLALGGEDITNASVKNFTGHTTTGSVAYTGLGWNPGMVLIGGVGATVLDTLHVNTDASATWGAATSPTNEVSNGWNDRDGLATSVANHIIRTDRTIGETGAAGNVAELTALTDGFTLNWTTLNRTSARYFALQLAGPRFAVGQFDSPTVDGNTSVTSVGFAPDALLLGGSGAATAVGTAAADGRWSIGAADGSGGAAMGGAADDAAATTNTAGYSQDDEAFATTNATGSILDNGRIDSFDSTGFTVAWDKINSTLANKYWYLAIAADLSETLTGESIPSAEAFGVGNVAGPVVGESGIASGENFDVGTVTGGLRPPLATPTPPWRMAYYALDGTLVGEIHRAHERQFHFNLNTPSTVGFKLDILNPMVKEIFTRSGEGYITISYNGALRMTAEIMADELAAAPVPGQRTPGVAVQATETMFPILQGRLIGKSRAGAVFTTPIDRGAALKQLLTTLNAEDATGLTMVRNGDLATMAGGPWHYKPYMELMLELSATVNGFDFNQTPLDPSTGSTGIINIYPVRGTTRSTAIFEFGVGKHNARDYRWALDRTNLINRAIALPSDFPDNLLLEAVTSENATSIAARGLREAVIAQDLVDVALRQQLADEHVAIRKAPMQRFFINPSLGGRAPIPFEDYDTGDIVEGRVVDQGIVFLNALVRVHGIHVDLDDQGQEATTLVVVPEEA